MTFLVYLHASSLKSVSDKKKFNLNQGFFLEMSLKEYGKQYDSNYRHKLRVKKRYSTLEEH